MREFFGFGGYNRPAEGYFSWQHITFVTALMIIMVIAAVIVGNKYKSKDFNEKNKVLVASAIAIDLWEIVFIVISCIRSEDPMKWTHLLPLFLCSIQLIAIPLAAFSKGRMKEAALDFVMIFGILGAIMGTYAAGQNYASYPVLSYDNVASGIHHVIAGFASLYIMISKMASMKKKNIVITFGIMLGFSVAAYIANLIIDYNYMFLMRGDGTPYDILYNLVGGNRVLYPMGVVALFILYITAFYFVYYLITKKKKEA